MNSKLFFLVLLMGLASKNTFAQEICNSGVLTQDGKVVQLLRQLRTSTDPERLQSGVVRQYQTLQEKVKTAPDQNLAVRNLDRFFPLCLLEALVTDKELKYYQERLAKVFSMILSDDHFDFSKKSFREVLKQSLQNQVLSTTIDARVSRFIGDSFFPRIKVLEQANEEMMNSVVNMSSLKQVLGEIDRTELLLLIHGGNPLQPTPESLLGQYIARTGAKTVVKQFERSPESHELGQRKLVVALSQSAFEVYRELFVRPEFLVHFHYPNEGTLALIYEGKMGSYMNMASTVNARNIPAGSILPHIALKSSEASRMMLVRELGAAPNDLNELREPWNLNWRGEDGVQVRYTAMGGYNSCTHWFGDLPIGDKLVNQYKFPGRADRYAMNNVPVEPQITNPVPYTLTQAEEYLRTRYIRDPYQLHEYAKLVSLVWNNTGKGHMQLSEIFGSEELQANLRGEYANPGWVAYRLTGNVSSQFVPFVFLMTDNHSREIPESFNPMIHAY